MKLFAGIFLSILAAEGISAPVADLGGKSVPEISFASPTLSLPKIPSGFNAKFQFDFKNIGKSTLLIEGVKASCGCTEARPSQREIPPGGIGAIKVNFDSHGFQGQVSKEILVLSNDPRHPEMELKFNIQVFPTLVVEPKNIDYGTLSVKTARFPDVARDISVKDMVNLDTRVQFVGTDIPFLRVRVAKSLRNETRIKAVLSSPGDFRGNFQGLIKIATNSKFYPVLFVLVQGTIKD